MNMANQLTKEQAIEFGDSKLWEKMTLCQKAEFQINQKYLCMPFEVFHEAVEKTVNRPVFTHEFGPQGVIGLKQEIFKGKEPPTLEEIISLIPEEKRIVFAVEENKEQKNNVYQWRYVKMPLLQFRTALKLHICRSWC